MPAIQLPLTLAQRHNNQQLFSDHYLNVTLPQRPEWVCRSRSSPV